MAITKEDFKREFASALSEKGLDSYIGSIDSFIEWMDKGEAFDYKRPSHTIFHNYRTPSDTSPWSSSGNIYEGGMHIPSVRASTTYKEWLEVCYAAEKALKILEKQQKKAEAAANNTANIRKLAESIFG